MQTATETETAAVSPQEFVRLPLSKTAEPEASTPERTLMQRSDLLTQLAPGRWDGAAGCFRETRRTVVGPGEDFQVYHRNYLEYLARCWGGHYAAVLSPDHIWYTLLSELGNAVLEDPEPYRPLFTDSPEKKTLQVQGGEVLPLADLFDLLAGSVPTETSLFLPEFTTTTEHVRLAEQAVFAGMCTPYYSYEVYLCGIPELLVLGTWEDWCRLSVCWRRLQKHLLETLNPSRDPLQRWRLATIDLLEWLPDALTGPGAPDFFRDMFRLEKCGSGSQYTVSGWWTKLYRQQPEDEPLVEAFPAHVALVPYRHMDLEKDYELRAGLFSSHLRDGVLWPEFGQAVFEVLAT